MLMSRRFRARDSGRANTFVCRMQRQRLSSIAGWSGCGSFSRRCRAEGEYPSLSLAVLADPNAELLRQLTRIANALDKTGPSPWADWSKAVASFILGIITAYVGLWLQGRSSDRREQHKMR